MASQFPKTCKVCERRYICAPDHDSKFFDWEALPLLGIQPDDEEPLELRNCHCGSTIAVVVAPAPVNLFSASRWSVYRVADGCRLEGTASAELIAAVEADQIGAAPAYLDGAGVWQYVPPSQVELVTRFRKERVFSVFLDLVPDRQLAGVR